MEEFQKLDVPALKRMARTIRSDIVKMVHAAGSGHPGGSLSAADIVTALYFNVLDIKPEQPKWEDRDRFVLSKGHCCPVLYACLARRGFFDVAELNTLRKYGSKLQGHPDMHKCPGVEMSAGTLGNGLGCAVGAYSTPIPPPIPVQTLPAIPDETRHPLHSKPYRPFQSKVGHPFQNKPATQAG